MNYFKSMIAQIHESQVSEKGRTDGEAKIVGSLILAIILVLYLMLLFMILYVLEQTSSQTNEAYFNWLGFFGESRSGYKIMILITFLIFTGIVYIVLRPKFYNATLKTYYDLSHIEQKRVNKSGQIVFVIFFALPVIGISICLYLLK